MKNIFFSCPECESNNYETTGDKWSEFDELIEIYTYKCNECGCEFDEEDAYDTRNDEKIWGY